MRRLLTTVILCALALPAATLAGEPVPLTSDHWHDSPPTVLERETGIPASVIEEERRDERARNSFPSIPGSTGPRPATPGQQEAPADAFPAPQR